LIPILLTLLACFQAKKSPYDVQTPTGGLFSFAFSPSGSKTSEFSLTGSEENNTQNSTPSFAIPSTHRFFTKGVSLSLSPSSTEGFSNWSIQPSLPTNLSLNPENGILTCACPSSMPYHKASYTITSTHSSGSNVSKNIELEILHPYQLLDGGSGVTTLNHFNGYPIEYQGKLFVFIKQGAIHVRVWDGVNFGSTAWISATPTNGLGTVSAEYPKAIVWNDKLYAMWPEGNLVKLFRYDGGVAWVEINNGANNYINQNNTQTISSEHIVPAIYSSRLIVCFLQNNNLIKTIIYDGVNFQEHSFSLTNLVGLAVQEYNNALYYAYSETGNKTYVAKAKPDFSGFDSVDPLSYTTNTTGQPRFMVADNRLYCAWQEFNGHFEIRLKVFNGSVWTSLDGHPGNSLINFNTLTSTYPTMVYHNGNIVMGFLEGSNLRAKVYRNGEWMSLGIAPDYNLRITDIASYPRITLVQNLPIFTWSENLKTHVRGFLDY
jgi:hypothetical protein